MGRGSFDWFLVRIALGSTVKVSLAPQSTCSPLPDARTCWDLERIYRDNIAFAWRMVTNMGVRRADVPDVVQEVFITVHRRLGEVEIKSSVRAWIYGICVRACSNYRKRASTQREQLFWEPPEHGIQNDERASAKLDLMRALELLDADQRAVFVLYEVEGLTMREVAEALDCPPTTAYSRLYAARRVVQAAFDTKETEASQ